jgi:hypothetical protein
MTTFLFSNNAATTLAGPIAANATTLNLAAGTGALFPNPAAGQQFTLTLVSQTDAAQIEVVYCTARSTDTCTVVRGQEGTPTASFLAGDFASNDLTAGTTAAFIQATQLQTDAPNYAVDSGSVNAVVATFTPLPTSLAQLTGAALRVKIANTNTAGVTLNVVGAGTALVTNPNGSGLSAGQLVVGMVATFVYDGSGFELGVTSGAVGGVLTGNLPNPGMAAGAAVANIGFTPVQQGGGTNQQGGHKLFMGWDGVAPLLTVDSTNIGEFIMRSMFKLSAFGTDSCIMQFPTDTAGSSFYIVVGAVNVPTNGSGLQTTTFNLTNNFTFPTSFLGALACFDGNLPPFGIGLSCQPASTSTINVTLNSTVNTVLGVVYVAFGF